MNKNFFQALAVLIGTIIGVGLFSLPYITSKVGIWVMLVYFLVLGSVIILVKFFYGEVALQTQGQHRLPGYAEKYLGKWGKRIAILSSLVGLIGSLLAYLIIGGGFLFYLLNPIFGGSSFIYTLIYFSFGAFLIYLGVKSIAKAEFFLLILFFVALGLIFKYGFSFINLNHLFVFNPKFLFLPYGAVLFSLSGITLIPEVKELLFGNSKDLKKVTFLAVLISGITYLIFIFLILGISGQNTSVDAISGLNNFLGNRLIGLALIFGVLTTFTSFLTLGLTLKKILWYDLKIGKELSWALACFAPLVLFVLGMKDFIGVISFTGGVMGGISIIIIILMYLKIKKRLEIKPSYVISLSRAFAYFLILFFILGIIYEIIYFVK